MKRLALFLAALLTLSSCTVLDVEKVALSQPLPIPPGSQPAPVGFNKIRYAIPTGTTTMGISTRSIRCPLHMKKVQKGVSGRSFPNDEYKQIFGDTLAGLGYDVTGDPGRMFDEQEDIQRTAYAIGARVVNVKMDVCEEESVLFQYKLGTVGEAMVEVEWSIFDVLHKKNVYKTTTKGYADLTVPNDEGQELLLQDAFESAVHNLGTNHNFFDLIFTGKEPQDLPDTIGDPDEQPLPIYDPQEHVTIDAKPVSTKPASPAVIESARHNAVLVETAGGHGSGFFITKDGHILTNAHVVGHATRARIVTSDKKEKLIAEVLRVDALRDVALLRLEKIPAGLTISPAPIQSERPQIGEDVYAVGAPNLTKLQDSVTKGIVSAVRYDRRKKLWYLQSDVFVYSGNSGGPLLDSKGNIVGLCVSGYDAGDQALTGLNLFIPIRDAFDALSIDVPGADAAPVSLKE